MRLRYAIPVLLALAASSPGVSAQGPPGQAPVEKPVEKAAEEPVFDPYGAEKSVQIGLYYMKKGNYDAAIERFQDAASRKPGFARPYRRMGEAYEKKGEKAEAVKAYQKYVEILPSAEDAGKVRKRIEKLSRELERAKARRRSH